METVSTNFREKLHELNLRIKKNLIFLRARFELQAFFIEDIVILTCIISVFLQIRISKSYIRNKL